MRFSAQSCRKALVAPVKCRCPGPIPDLLIRNLHFSKTSKGVICTSRLEKAALHITFQLPWRPVRPLTLKMEKLRAGRKRSCSRCLLRTQGSPRPCPPTIPAIVCHVRGLSWGCIEAQEWQPGSDLPRTEVAEPCPCHHPATPSTWSGPSGARRPQGGWRPQTHTQARAHTCNPTRVLGHGPPPCGLPSTGPPKGKSATDHVSLYSTAE